MWGFYFEILFENGNYKNTQFINGKAASFFETQMKIRQAKVIAILIKNLLGNVTKSDKYASLGCTNIWIATTNSETNGKLLEILDV